MINENLIANNSFSTSNQEQIQERLTLKLKEIQEENQKLKYELSIQLSKECLHKSTMAKVKQIQDDYEKSYLETYNDFKQRESKIKEQYQQYSSKLQSESALKEDKFLEEINDLKAQLKSKNELITKQQADLMGIIEKNSKNEISFHLKEKDFEALIVSKERKQAELEQAVKSISFEATEKIKSLSNQLDHFQSKIQNTITLEDDGDQDEGFGHKREIMMTTNDMNHSLPSLDYSSLKRGQCPNDCTNKLSELEQEIYALKSENERLYLENIGKDKEIAFWKSVKQEFKPMNHSTKGNDFCSIRNHQSEPRPYAYAYGDRCNGLQEDYDTNYLNQNREVNETKEQYQPSQYSHHEYIPHSVKYKKINNYPLMNKSSGQKSVINKSYASQRDFNNYNGENYRTKNNCFNESGLALKHDTSMKELHIKIQTLRDKLKG